MIENKALLIIDIQDCFTHRNASFNPLNFEALQNKYNPVFVSKFFNEKDSFFRTALNWNKCEKDSPEYQLSFKPKKDSIFIEHSNYTCVTKKLIALLKKLDIKEVHLCGMDTDACVLKTGFDLIEAGFKIHILQDYTFSSGKPELHEAALKIIKRNLGKDCLI